MKIKDLILKNIQSHISTHLKFHKFVNVLTGKSDGGKSVVTRGIKFAVTNRPLGDGLRTHNTEESSVNINNKVIRTKSDSENKYTVGGVVSKAIRSGVPAEVSDTLNLSELNIQEQKNHFFLIDEKPGAVASKLNSLAGLDIMRDSLKEINSSVRDINSEIKFTEKGIKEDKEQIEELNWVLDASVALREIEILSEKLGELEEEYDTLVSLQNQYRAIKEQRSSYYSEDLVHAVNTILSVINSVKEIDTELSTLKNKFTQYKSINAQLSRIAFIDINVVSAKVDKLKGIREDIETLEDLVYERTDIMQKLNEVQKKQKETKEALSSIKTCPTCGQLTGE